MTRSTARSVPRLPFPRSAALLAVALALSACNDLPKRPGSTVETVSSARLEKKNPVDVVVAPVENATGRKGVPVAALREAFQDGLVKRRYSPLALEYVDRKVVNAAYRPGLLQEEAVLQVVIEGWDDSLWESRGAITVKARARMLDAEDPAAGQLWVGSVDHRFDFGSKQDQLISADARLRFACDQIAAEILAALPARNPAAGG